MRWSFLIRHALALGLALLLPLQAVGQGGAAPAGGKAFTQPQLDQLLAPVALHPDALLAQVFMAATYPLEVVSASRWVQANPKVTGKALEDAMQKQPWDASVKSLAAFPSVLQMMNDKLDWTQQVGDAFLGQRAEVMKTVQSLRRKAYEAGNLKASAEQKVIVEKTVIVIEPATTVVYVPVYNPTAVYGAWWHPAYVPYYWYPPGYVARPGAGFAAGVVAGAALWGGCNWHGNDVTINVNRYNTYNRTTITNVKWEHDASHRKGVAYRDPTVAQRYERKPATATRDAGRGPAEAGRPEPSTRDVDRPGPVTRDRPGPGPRDGDGPDRPGRPGERR
jgi:hypothetical protein